MPRAWSSKDERTYEHIRDASRRRGKDPDTAEEIAARTVNKQRRLQGRTPSRRTQGTGNPNRPLAERTKPELVNLARDRGLRGTSRMTKADLVRALGRRRAR